MQGKGLIQFFAIALVLVCIYQLSFTWVTNRVENRAREHARTGLIEQLEPSALKARSGNDRQQMTLFVDSINRVIKARERAYLDSIANEVVYDLWIKDFTYKRCKQQELNLGLDLRGGMSVTLQVSLVDLIQAMSGYNSDSIFVQAIKLAEQKQAHSRTDFITLFAQSFNELDPNARLAAIFATRENQDRIPVTASDEEVIRVIREEAQDAITRTYNIIRSRIDKFGVTQPSVTLDKNTNRIYVELPGVDDPNRVRTILQSTARLEFWETHDNREIINKLVEADKTLARLLEAEKFSPHQDTIAPPLLRSLDASATQPDTPETTLLKESKKDTTPSLLERAAAPVDDTIEASTGYNPLFEVLGMAYDPNTQKVFEGSVIGYAQGRDTATVRQYLSRNEVRALFPRNIKFLWSAKAVNEESDLFALHAIKTKLNDPRAPLEGDRIVNARQDFDQLGKPEINMTMDAEGAKIWRRLTSENIGKQIAIVLDDRVYSAPVVQSEIAGGRSSITGNFTIDEAKDLANILKTGKLPAPARIVEEEVVGPTLGKESIAAGLRSILLGLVMVLFFMWFYYSKGGMVANGALLLNLFFVMGVLASLGATLTLPGIAGLVLTIGMAVDANVIIYERIREELAKGHTLRKAISDGYKNSYSAIIDGNVTTLLTAIILAVFGAGPILGFATVLIIGILSSLFTAVLLTQVFYQWLTAREKSVSFYNKFTARWFDKVNVDWIAKRKIAYIFSGLIILSGIVSIIVDGFDLGVDFKGGRAYVVRFEHPVSVNEVRNAVREATGSQPIVRTFGSPNQIKITTTYLIDHTGEETDSLVEATLYGALSKFIDHKITFEEFQQRYKQSSQKVGPTIAEDIKRGAVYATIFGLLVIFLYILMRFRRWQFGLGATVALLHDVAIVLAVFALFKNIMPFSLELNEVFIGALLTIIGYSINDTVIIFDRIREYLSIHHTEKPVNVINRAINATLSRTIITSLTTLLVVIILFLLGGEVIRGFAFALLIGILSGTYSTILIAVPIMVDFSKKEK